MAEKAFEEPSPSDWERWEEALRQGVEPSSAAKELRQTCTAFRKNDPARHAAALLVGREARADFVDERVEVLALADDAPPPIVLAWAKRWNPAYSDKQTVELTGAEGGPIEVEGGHVVAIEDVVTLAARLGIAGVADQGGES